jgi:hypothetical protein
MSFWDRAKAAAREATKAAQDLVKEADQTLSTEDWYKATKEASKEVATSRLNWRTKLLRLMPDELWAHSRETASASFRSFLFFPQWEMPSERPTASMHSPIICVRILRMQSDICF